MTQSTSLLSINQIINYYDSHITNQNNRVQIDYPIMLVGLNWLVQIDMLVFVTPIILGIFLLENPIKETMNHSNLHYVVWGENYPKMSWLIDFLKSKYYYSTFSSLTLRHQIIILFFKNHLSNKKQIILWNFDNKYK